MKYLQFLSLFIFLACCSPANKNEGRQLPDLSRWKGEWTYKEDFDGGSLTVSETKGDSIAFQLSGYSGGNTGEIEGWAKVDGNKANFSSFENEDTCIIKFELSGDSLITITQERGTCGMGMGVYVSGKFYNSQKHKLVQTTEGEYDDAQLGYSKDDSLLKSLVGDKYDAFANSSQLTSENEDLDSLNAKVESSGVRGLFTQMENIVMIDSSKNIWAAVIYDEKVYYYTNVERYKNKLPKTIENWRERFKDYPVIYGSK